MYLKPKICFYEIGLCLSCLTCWGSRHHASVPAFMAVRCVLEHRLHLFLGGGGEGGCGLVTVRYSCRGRGCSSDGRSGAPLHLLFLLQLIRLQVHVRGGHGALHVWFTTANREMSLITVISPTKNLFLYTEYSWHLSIKV